MRYFNSEVRIIDIEKLEWFCPQPFINTVTTGRKSSPCCVIKDWDFAKAEENTIILQKEMLSGGGPQCSKNCGVCIEQEKHPAPSHRQIYNDKWQNGEYKEFLPLLMQAIKTPKILTLEYQAPSNFCNLRCHMCHAWSSSSIAREDKAIGKETSFSAQHSKPLIKRSDNTDYDEVLKTIFELKLVGGETLAIEHNYDMMRRAIHLDVAKNITLSITTNATLTPKFDDKDIFDYIPYFKACKMIVSIELWGEKNSYIRFPSKWKTIYDNTVKFAQMPRTKVMFASCVSSLNVGYFDEIATGTHDMKLAYPNRFDDFASGSLVIGGTSLYEVTAVPPKIREQYIDKYYRNAHHAYIETFIKLCSYLENMPYDEEMMWEMLKDVKKRDKHRGTCLTDIFPEWKPYYDKV
jgi:hypothetical protein